METAQSRKFILLHININSLLGPAKFAAIRTVLDSNKFDLICLQETKIGADVPNSLLEANGYIMLRRDRASGSGGILIYIKSTYKLISSHHDPLFETIVFTILVNHQRVNFISSYNPHYEFAAGHLEHIEHVIKRLGVGSTVLVGDLNQDLALSRGDKLLELMADFNFSTNLAHPTHHQRSAATQIDVLFANEPRLVIDSKTVACPFSNHSFVLAVLDIGVAAKGGAFLEARSLKKANLDKMNLCLAGMRFDLVDSATSIEEKWLVLKKLLLDVVDSCAPVKKLRLKKDQSLPWIDKECLFYLHKRNTMHRKALASKSGRESAEWQAFRSARNFCKALLRRKMVEFFADKDGSYFKSTKSFLAFYKRDVKTEKDSSAAIQSIRSPTSASINEDSAIASAFKKLGNNLDIDVANIIYFLFRQRNNKINVHFVVLYFH